MPTKLRTGTGCVAIKHKMLDNGSLSILCTELSEMLRSGMLISEGFSILAEQAEGDDLKPVYESICRQTQGGAALGAAMREAGIFPEYMLRMIGVAEQTGALEHVFKALADYYDRQERLRRTIRSAVGYPLLLFFIVLGVFFVFLTEVLPVFDRVFAQIGATMLPAAVVFLNAGLWLAKAKWWIAGVVCAAAAAVLMIRGIPPLRAKASARAAALFSGTGTGRKITDFRLASVLSLSVSGASDIVEALAMSDEFVSGFDRDGKVKRSLALVRQGESFASAAEKTGLFAPVYCRMLLIGERAGATESIMRDIARRSEADMAEAVDKLTGRIEPAAVMVLSVLVGLLLLSVMLPLVGIMSAL